MALDNESGDQVGSIHEKNQMSKISWDYLLKYCKYTYNVEWIRMFNNIV
jgi:hypothetical protein